MFGWDKTNEGKRDNWAKENWRWLWGNRLQLWRRRQLGNGHDVIIEHADKTFEGKFSRHVKKIQLFWGVSGRTCVILFDLSAHLDSLQRGNPIRTLARRIMGYRGRSYSEFLFFKVEQRRQRSDLQRRYACKSGGAGRNKKKKRKSN